MERDWHREPYRSVSLWAVLCLKCFRKCWHWFPIPPLVPNTKGVNEPSSTSNTRHWYFCFFSSSWSLNTSDVGLFWKHYEFTCVTPLAQKPPPLMSNLASEIVTVFSNVVARGWRCGLISTLLETLLMNGVNKWRTQSCLCPTKPPFLWEMVGLKQIFPHTHIHLVDRLEANYSVGVAHLWTPAYSGLSPDLQEASHLTKNLYVLKSWSW